MLLTVLLLFLVVFTYFILFLFENYPRHKRPPGPLRFPPFGSLIQVALQNKTNYLAIEELAKKYGEVMSIKVGFVETVVLSTHEAFWKIFNMSEASGRDFTGLVWDRNLKQNIGLLYANGRPLQIMKDFCSQTLQHYGYGDRNDMKKLVYGELEFLLNAIEAESQTNPLNLVHFHSTFFHKSAMNVIFTLVTGNRLEYNDERLQKLQTHQHEFYGNGTPVIGLVMAYPSMRSIFPAYRIIMRGIAGYHKEAKELLINRRKEYDPKNIDSFIDEFIQRIDEDAKKNTPFFTDDQFSVVFTDLMQVGSEPMGNIMNFIILHLSCNEDMQKRAYQEIISVTRNKREVLTSDSWRMPYTQCVILEALRWSRVCVFGAPRLALEDFKYGNYEIKKGTSIMANFHTLLFNEKVWKDPNIFRPTRFLGNDGKVDKKISERMIMFGTGSRACFAETFASDILFLFTTSVLTRFKLSLPNGVKPILEPECHIVLCPHPYQAIVTPRTNLESVPHIN